MTKLLPGFLAFYLRAASQPHSLALDRCNLLLLLLFHGAVIPFGLVVDTSRRAMNVSLFARVPFNLYLLLGLGGTGAGGKNRGGTCRELLRRYDTILRANPNKKIRVKEFWSTQCSIWRLAIVLAFVRKRSWSDPRNRLQLLLLFCRMLLGLNEPSRQRHHFHLYSEHLHFVFGLRQNNTYRRSHFSKRWRRSLQNRFGTSKYADWWSDGNAWLYSVPNWQWYKKTDRISAFCSCAIRPGRCPGGWR